MSRPQATVRRVGRRPTANPKSEIRNRISSRPGTLVPLRDKSRYTVVVNAESQSGINLAYTIAGAAAYPGTGGSQDRDSEQIQPTPRIGNGGSIVVGKGGTLVAKDPSGSE